MSFFEPDDEDAPRTAHVHMRAQPSTVARLREAARLREQDLTSFVLGAALDRATEIVAQERRTRLHMALIAEDPDRFARDPRIPDDPELAALVARSLRERDRELAERDRAEAADDDPFS